jgi:Carboxypeptidase regulatory-like domain/TonB dependent receptor
MRLSSGVRSGVCWIFPLFFGLTAAFAQYRGSLQGTVTDDQGAVVPQVTVTLIDHETNRELTAQTNGSGVYNIGSLPPSRYTLTAEKAGFKKTVLENVGILSEQPNAVDITLHVGQAAETVMVNGDAAPLLDTETPTVSGTVTSQEVQTLPAYGRDPLQLLQLAPGAFGDGSQAAGGGSNDLPSRNGPGGSSATSGIFATQNTPAVSIGGGRQELTNIEIDGVNSTDAAWGGTTIITPNLDSIKEIRVVTNDYDAEDGRYGAGQVKIITQNGTNSYHGSAHWRADRPGFNAYQRYNGVSPVQKNITILNDFGGSLGAPILHDKLFGFFSYETVHSSGGTNFAGWFETPQFRAAAVSGSVAQRMFGYKGAAPLPGTVDESASDAVPKNCAFIGLVQGVNCNFIAGQGLDIGSPLTTGLGTQDPSFVSSSEPGVGNGLDGIPDIQYVSQSYSQPLVEQQYQGRVDFNVTSKDLVAVSFFYVPVSQTVVNGSARAMNKYQQNSNNETATVLWDRTFSLNLQNEFRGNVGGWRENSLKDNPNSPWGLPVLDIANLATSTGIGNVTPANIGISNPVEFDQWTYAGKDVLTKVYHSHTLKMGGEVSRLLFLDTAPWNARPTYDFNNVWDLLNDAPIQEFATFNPSTGVPSDFRFDSRESIYGFFAQDSYKVKPNLTLTAGLRWEYFGPISDKYGHLPVVELGQGADVITGIKVRTGGNLFNSSKTNLGPQVGFAWSPAQFRDKLVLRGGFGIAYTALQEANALDGRNNPPFLSSVLYLQGSSIFYGTGALPSNSTSFYGYGANPATLITFNPATNLPEAGQAPVNLIAYEQKWPTTRNYHYSFDVQQDLGYGWMFMLGYQGTASRHLTRLYNYGLYEYAQLAAAGQGTNGFNPEAQSITMYDDEGYGNFNALLAVLRHRFSNSFQLESQYRWSKGMDTGSNNYSPAQHNGACSCDGGSYQYTMNNEYGPSDFDVTNAYKLFGIWSPSLFLGQGSLLGKIAGGWTLSGILNFHSGFPWNPNDPNLGLNGIYQGSGTAYGGGGVLRPGYYLGGFNAGNFKTENYPNGALSMFPENNPSTGAPCYVPGPYLSAYGQPAGTPNIIAGTAAPGPIPCAPAIGRNSFRAPGYSDTDATIGKSLPIKILGENSNLVFNANFYNLFNKVNLTNVDPNVNDSTFGMALAALGSRTIDFQLRFSF